MNASKFEEFIDGLVHDASAKWEASGEAKLTEGEMYSLNDLLSKFFGYKS
jgi:hypothetical protein